jgi:hypothetical protein
MKASISLDLLKLGRIRKIINQSIPWSYLVGGLAFTMSSAILAYSLINDKIVAYGDAESHLNISKRVIDSITPGFAQLGGIWLPLPHLMMLPFIWSDYLWRTGLAGAIVSGICYIVSGLFIFKTLRIITKNDIASFVGFLIFALNPNVLYMQSTPMTELPLIMFFVLSNYFFIQFLLDDSKTMILILSGIFGFCATLSRYDGWFLVLIEAGIIVLMYWRKKANWGKLQGKLIAYATPAFFGIIVWMVWDYLILGDPFYFTNSQFSAKSQQQGWASKGELPSYHNIFSSITYYFVTVLGNVGILVFCMTLIGAIVFLKNGKDKNRFYIFLLLFVPFIFYIVTLFAGQSIIFIPHLTPISFEWRLFNVRYGVVAVPFVAFFSGYLFYRSKLMGKVIVILLLFMQVLLYTVGYADVLTYKDGTVGLSQSKRMDAEVWIRNNYDGGKILLDDYSRNMSLVRSGVRMQDIIYLGNKPYYAEALKHPEKYATWIIIQEKDDMWKNFYRDESRRAYLYTYYVKVYTSKELLIFKLSNPRTLKM